MTPYLIGAGAALAVVALYRFLMWKLSRALNGPRG